MGVRRGSGLGVRRGGVEGARTALPERGTQREDWVLEEIARELSANTEIMGSFTFAASHDGGQIANYDTRKAC